MRLLLLFGLMTTCAWAQRPPMHVPVGPPPLPRAPVYHAPVYQPPVYQPPAYRMPAYGLNSTRIPSSPANGIGMLAFRHPFPNRPLPLRDRFYTFPVFANPFWTYNFCWWGICDPYWTSSFVYNVAPADQWNPADYTVPPSSPPVSVYGMEREDIPQLFLKDGTILNVTDYWLIDGQLHFKMIEQSTQPTEEQIPFDELDLQKTIDVNTGHGFRFVLRNEPFEQYVLDHPDGAPEPLSPAH